MKIFTTKRANKIDEQNRRILQVTFYLFGFHFLTENHFAEVEQKEVKHNYELEEIIGCNEWLSNVEFDKFQNQLANR